MRTGRMNREQYGSIENKLGTLHPPSQLKEVCENLSLHGATVDGTSLSVATAATSATGKRMVLLGYEREGLVPSRAWNGQWYEGEHLYHLEEGGMNVNESLRTENESTLPFTEYNARITMNHQCSLQLEELQDRTLHIGGRASHILLLDCDDLHLTVDLAPIVGIYLIRCHRCNITILGQRSLPSLGVENCETIFLRTTVSEGFTLTNYGSMYININGLHTHLHPLEGGCWKLISGGGYQKHLLLNGGGEVTTILE